MASISRLKKAKNYLKKRRMVPTKTLKLIKRIRITPNRQLRKRMNWIVRTEKRRKKWPKSKNQMKIALTCLSVTRKETRSANV